MAFSRFEEILVWQKSKDLTLKLYMLFLENRDFGFREQLQRASVSVMNNIAEGFERNSNKEFIRFLYIALASCAELRTQVYLSKEVGILNTEINKDLVERTRMLSAMIRKFIKTRVENFS